MFNYTSLGLILAQAFFLTPLYLKTIGQSLYGSWLAISNILSWVALVDPGIFRITSQRISVQYAVSNRAAMGKTLSEALALSVTLSVIPLTFLLFTNWPGTFFPLSPSEQKEISHACTFSLISMALLFIEAPIGALTNGMHRVLTLGAIQLSSQLTLLLTTAYCLLFAGWGLSALPFGLLARGVVSLSLLIFAQLITKDGIQNLRIRLWGSKGFFSDTTDFKAGFLFNLGTSLRSNCYFLVTAKMLSPQFATVLFVTSQALNPLQQVMERTISAPLTSIAHLVSTGSSSRCRRVLMQLRSYFGFMIFSALIGIVSLNSAFVKLWMGADWFGGNWLTIFLALEMSENLLLNTQGEILYAAGFLRKFGWTRLLEGALKLPLQICLSMFFGLVGIPVGGYLVTLVLRIGLLSKIESQCLGIKPSQTRKWALGEAGKNLLAVSLGAVLCLSLTSQTEFTSWSHFLVATGVIATLAATIGLAFHRPALTSLKSVLLRFSPR